MLLLLWLLQKARLSVLVASVLALHLVWLCTLLTEMSALLMPSTLLLTACCCMIMHCCWKSCKPKPMPQASVCMFAVQARS